jgi:hypothetical protein
LEGLATEDVGIFYGHFINFKAIWYIFWPFGIFSPVLVYFSQFWVPGKSGNTENEDLFGFRRAVRHQRQM